MTIITDKKKIEEILRNKIERLIAELCGKVEKCTVVELCYFISSLHFIFVEEYLSTDEDYNSFERQQKSDIYKFIISIIACIENIELDCDYYPDQLFITELIELTKDINRDFECIGAINLYCNPTYETDSKQIRLELDDLKSNEIVSKFNLYGIRIQHNLNRLLELKSLDSTINELHERYFIFNDLLIKKFDIEIDDIIKFVKELRNIVDYRYTAIYSKFIFKTDGLFDQAALENHVLFASIQTFTKDEIKAISPHILRFIDVFSFNSAEFNRNELRVHYIDRKPIIKLPGYYIISFDLLSPALQTGIHYALLDSDNTKEEYKSRESAIFEEKISQIAIKYGYNTIERNTYLFEGNKPLGDIDLTIRNANGRTIFIESKSYSLVTSIQAHDPLEMDRQLQRQKKEWEEKVLKRIEYIKKRDSVSDIEYIIVTRNVEILAHFSKLLVINLVEFEYWLKNDGNLSFKEIYDHLYDTDSGNVNNPIFDFYNGISFE